MLKKLAVPLFSLALATFGCSSSTTPTGTGGTSGGTGGSSATGGKSGTGGSSATGGAGGAATATGGAGGAKATGGAGGAKATGGAGGGAAATDAGRMADCTVTTLDGGVNDVLSPSIFCAQMAAYCPTQFATFADEAACESKYSTSGQENCRSYHMCWGVEGITNTSPANPGLHCQHTVGIGLCQATTDAASGN